MISGVSTPRSARRQGDENKKVNTGQEVPKGGILKKSSFAAPMDRAEQLRIWKQQKASKMASRQQRSSKSRKTVMFGPDVAEPASSGSSKKRVLTPGRKASRPRASLARNKSRMSISGKGGSLRKKLSTLGTAVRVRTKTSMGASSMAKAKVSMGGAVRKSSRRLMHTRS